MKAVLCKAFGPPESLAIEEVEPLKPGKGQVVISVKACGVNFPDALIIQGKYQSKPPFPFTPGSEVSGIVKELGEGVDFFKVGTHVMGFIGMGGFAEEVVADASQIIPMPHTLDFPTASAFLLTYGTSHHALKDRAQLQQGETLMVLGAAGGVGLAAVEIGKAMGARVIAAASSNEKLEVCKQHGADEVINYSTEDLRDRIKQLTGGKGIDVAFDPLGGDYSEPVLRSMAWGGRFLVIGFASGDIPRIPLNLPLLKACSIVGVFWGSFMERDPRHGRKNIQELITLMNEGKLKPHVSATHPLEHVADALNDLMERKVIGKAVLVTSLE
ncbi:MAG TPA: NADPH:quinone oxidoreductase family protein [Ktedonobacteraceae bacterium]|nr:NADPH:quinone oxidoreductase family protein [Ktedonobacteraceae bacterium]